MSTGNVCTVLMQSSLAPRLTWAVPRRPSRVSWKPPHRFYLAQPWRDKLAAGFTNSGCLCGDKLNTLLQMTVFAAQHSMIWVGLDLLPARSSMGLFDGQLNRLGSSLGAMAQSNVEQSPDLAPPPEDRRTAAHLGERVARLAERMARTSY